MAGSSPLGLLRQQNSRALNFKFNGMQVDLFRKVEFDNWFETKMTEVPQQLHLWKKHFDNWANKRIAKVLAEEDAQIAQGVFDDFLDTLQGEG